MSGASDCHRGLKAMLALFSRKDDFPAQAMVEQAEAPAPRFGSAEARVYAFARQIVMEHGPDEASRLADRFVAVVQHLTRLPPDAR